MAEGLLTDTEGRDCCCETSCAACSGEITLSIDISPFWDFTIDPGGPNETQCLGLPFTAQMTLDVVLEVDTPNGLRHACLWSNTFTAGIDNVIYCGGDPASAGGYCDNPLIYLRTSNTSSPAGLYTMDTSITWIVRTPVPADGSTIAGQGFRLGSPIVIHDNGCPVDGVNGAYQTNHPNGSAFRPEECLTGWPFSFTQLPLFTLNVT